MVSNCFEFFSIDELVSFFSIVVFSLQIINYSMFLFISRTGSSQELG
jgi:hypothetical protein